MSDKVKIIAVIDGGVLQLVLSSDPDVEVTLFDYDNISASENKDFLDIHAAEKFVQDAAKTMAEVF